MNILQEFLTNLALQQILPYVYGIVITAAIGWIGVLYTKLTGEQIDAKHQASLQSALVNGLNWAIQIAFKGKLPPVVTQADQERLVGLTGQYLKASVPQAAKHFGIVDKKSGAIDEYKVEQMMLTKMPVTIDGTVTVVPSAQTAVQK